MKRDYVIDEVVVTEVARVSNLGNGVFVTEAPVAVTTITNHGISTVITTSAAASSTVEPVVAAEVPSAAVFVQEPAAATTEAPVVIAAATSIDIPAPVVSVSIPAVVIPTPTPSSTPVTTGNTGSSGKRGLAYNDASLLAGFDGSKASWAYNWGATSGGTVPSQFEYVPMLWGLKGHTDGWAANAQAAIDSGSSHLLYLNEPDLGAQSNVSPKDAATGWTANMEQFHGKAKLGSPAVTNGGSPMGITWMTEFLSECSSCSIDFTVMHWYDSASNFAYFKNYVADFYAASGGRPIWITEFGASGSVDEQVAFLDQATAWLDSLDYVERYSYFMVAEGNLVSGGKPSTLGKAFAGMS